MSDGEDTRKKTKHREDGRSAVSQRLREGLSEEVVNQSLKSSAREKGIQRFEKKVSQFQKQ